MKYPVLEGKLDGYMRRVVDLRGRIPALMDTQRMVVISAEDYCTIMCALQDAGKVDILDYLPEQKTRFLKEKYGVYEE